VARRVSFALRRGFLFALHHSHRMASQSLACAFCGVWRAPEGCNPGLAEPSGAGDELVLRAGPPDFEATVANAVVHRWLPVTAYQKK
jgi:hypothetical protein